MPFVLGRTANRRTTEDSSGIRPTVSNHLELSCSLPHRIQGVKPPKWQERMLPYVFVGVGIGPMFDWNRTYAVVPLRRLLGGHRPIQVNHTV